MRNAYAVQVAAIADLRAELAPLAQRVLELTQQADNQLSANRWSDCCHTVSEALGDEWLVSEDHAQPYMDDDGWGDVGSDGSTIFARRADVANPAGITIEVDGGEQVTVYCQSLLHEDGRPELETFFLSAYEEPAVQRLCADVKKYIREQENKT
jgi:hypothetical protein